MEDVKQPVQLRIYSQEDRLNVAQILIKNGYQVNQAKKKRSESGKTVDYYLEVRELPEAADTAR